jgi:hypothetical protein
MSSQTQSQIVDPAVIRVDVLSGAVSYADNSIVVLTYGGQNYKVNDVFVVKGTSLGGATPANDLTLTVDSVSSKGCILTFSVSGEPFNATATYNIALPLSSSRLVYGSSIRYTRDASDITKQLKERIIYNEKKAGSPVETGKKSLIVGGRPQVNPAGVNHLPAGNAELLWQPYGNQFRLSYLFGRVQCGNCNGGAFNGDFKSSGPALGS